MISLSRKTKEKAVEDLLLQNYDQYYRLAYSYVHNEADAGDIVQNGAYKAIRSSSDLKEVRYAATWLYRIMLNEIFSFCKQKKTEPLEEGNDEPHYEDACNGVQREHNKKLNNGLPILHKVPPKRDYGRYFCIMAEKGGTSHGGLTEKLSPFFYAQKQEVNAYGR